jgi:hypothetical protein
MRVAFSFEITGPSFKSNASNKTGWLGLYRLATFAFIFGLAIAETSLAPARWYYWYYGSQKYSLGVGISTLIVSLIGYVSLPHIGIHGVLIYIPVC